MDRLRHEPPPWVAWLPPAIVTALLSLWGIDDWSLWFDETATASAIDRPLLDLLSMLRTLETPLGSYYVGLQRWVEVFGASEVALRLPSVFAAAGAAALTAEIGRRWHSVTVGLVAGLLLCLVPTITSFHAQEARPYAFVLLFACATVLTLLIATRDGRWRWWLAYGCAIGALGLSHFLALTLLPALLVWAWLTGGRRMALRWLGVTACALLPTGLVIRQATRSSVWDWIEPPTLTGVLQLPVEPVGPTILGWFLVGLATLALVRERGRWRWLLGAWMIAPPVMLLIASLSRPMIVPRYLLFVAPAIVLLASMALTRSRLVVPGLVLAMVLAVPAGVEQRQRTGMDDFRGAAAHVLDGMDAGDGILYVGIRPRIGFAYYLRAAVGPSDILGRGTAIESGTLAAPEAHAEASLLAPYPRVWVVSRGTTQPFAGTDVLRGRRLAETTAFRGSVVVERYDLEDAP